MLYTTEGTTHGWFTSQKGFGFIRPDSGSTDVIVHILAVERAPTGSANQSLSDSVAPDW
nr:cold shock domain-containing protein [Phyllobacterium sp. SYP-B3895]